MSLFLVLQLTGKIYFIETQHLSRQVFPPLRTKPCQPFWRNKMNCQKAEKILHSQVLANNVPGPWGVRDETSSSLKRVKIYSHCNVSFSSHKIHSNLAESRIVLSASTKAPFVFILNWKQRLVPEAMTGPKANQWKGFFSAQNCRPRHCVCNSCTNPTRWERQQWYSVLGI